MVAATGNFMKKETQTQVFSSELCEVSQTNHLGEYLLVTASRTFFLQNTSGRLLLHDQSYKIFQTSPPFKLEGNNGHSLQYSFSTVNLKFQRYLSI